MNISCPNCRAVIISSLSTARHPSPDIWSREVVCSRCRAVYRIEVNLLREGETKEERAGRKEKEQGKGGKPDEVDNAAQRS